jgi:hypothetical protein
MKMKDTTQLTIEQLLYLNLTLVKTPLQDFIFAFAH